MSNLTLSTNQAGWQSAAGDLTAWVMQHLVNREDVWGLYIPRPHGQSGSGAITAPRRTHRGRVVLDHQIVKRHFDDLDGHWIIGLHSTSRDNTSKWFALDIDRHEGQPESCAQSNFKAALAWYEKLEWLGFHPLLEDSNGDGGFHLMVVLDAPAPTPDVFGFMTGLTDDHQRVGLDHRPELFPKQAEIGSGQYGNWLRLPGRHHSREHWSRFWAGHRWLSGTDAVQHLLSHQLSSVSLIPKAPATSPSPSPSTMVRDTRVLGRGDIHLRGMRLSRNEQGLAIKLAATVREVADHGVWIRFPPFELNIQFWGVNSKGIINHRVESMLHETIGWNPDSGYSAFDPNGLNPLKTRPCQIVMKRESSGAIEASWLRPFETPLIDRREQPIERYMNSIPTGLSAGQKRSDHAYRFACFLVHDLKMTNGDSMPWLLRLNARWSVALPDAKLQATINNARRYGGRPRNA